MFSVFFGVGRGMGDGFNGFLISDIFLRKKCYLNRPGSVWSINLRIFHVFFERIVLCEWLTDGENCICLGARLLQPAFLQGFTLFTIICMVSNYVFSVCSHRSREKNKQQ